MLTAKYCNFDATFFAKIVPTDLNITPYYDKGVPFKIGFIRSGQDKVFNVPNLRTFDTTHTIHTFRQLEIKIGDKISFDNTKWKVEDVNFSYFQSANNRLIKQYFITLK